MAITRKNIEFCIKLMVSVGLIGFLIYKMDLATVKNVLVTLHPFYFMLALILLSTEVVLMALRTQNLLRTKHVHVSLWVLIKLNLISVFVGMFLPSRLGIDALRIYYLSKYTKEVVDSISTIAIDRVLNIVVMTGFAMGCYFLGGYMQRLPGLATAFIPFVGGILLLILFFIPVSQRWINTVLSRFKWGHSIQKMLNSIVHSVQSFRQQPWQFALLILFILVFQLVRITSSFVFSKALFIDVPYLYLFVMIPIVTLLGMLPVSIAGLGIVQGSSVYLFGLMGIPKEQAFGFSVLVFFTRILVTVPGLYFFYHEGIDTLFASVRNRKKKATGISESGM